MKPSDYPGPGRTYLGVECGGTQTIAILADDGDRCLRRVEAGAANMRLLTDQEMAAHFRGLAAQFPMPAALAIGMPGVLDEADRRRVRSAAARAWPGVPCFAGNDLETALAAAQSPGAAADLTRIVIISGTGSCCYGRGAGGRTVKVGGWGHFLGDRGSGYDIGLRALRSVIQNYDGQGAWPALGQHLLRVLMLNTPQDLTQWIQRASKSEVAALAVPVFEAWTRHDEIARAVLTRAASRLAADAAACARRLATPGQAVEFMLAGSILLKQPRFAGLVSRELRSLWPSAGVRPLPREGAWGAVALARKEWPGHAGPSTITVARRKSNSPAGPPASFIPRATGLSPTEERNPRSMKLGRMSVAAAVRLMLREEGRVAAVLERSAPKIERAVRLIGRSFRLGGRLFYVGAGTSGRLGVLDASECSPTFGTPPEMVQGIIAGGQPALWTSQEGAEDDAVAGAQAVRFRGITPLDVVVGIAASGRTPFVWGALTAAKKTGATTILLSFNPQLEFPRSSKPSLVLALSVGPEILTGSTRLKAGTATKILLNILTTLSMVRLGKVVENLMVDLRPSNSKLRERAVRIVRQISEATPDEARTALEKSAWAVKAALRRLREKRQKRRSC